MTKETQPAQHLSPPQGGTNVRLFRAESFADQQTFWLGRHTLALGAPAALSSIASIVLTISTASLLTYGSYARRVELHGIVLPSAGLVQIAAPATGWVQALKVKDGDTVASGTPLLALNTDTVTQNGDTQQQILRSLGSARATLLSQIDRQAQIRDQHDGELRQKIANLMAQIQQMDVQVAVKDEFTRKLMKDFADYSRYVAGGIGNLNEKEMQQQNWMRSKDELEELKSHSLRLQGELIETKARLATLHLQSDNETDDMRAKVSAIDQQVATAEAKHAINIISPASGKVTAIAGLPGQVVPAGTRVLTIVPSDQRMQAELLAPSTSIGFLRPGQRVLLRYSAFPYQKYGEHWGTMTEVSRAALQPDELKALVPSMLAAEQSKTYYKVTVIPDHPNVLANGRQEPLQASMQTDARVLLDSRPLYQWILEPLYGLRGALIKPLEGRSG